MKNFRIGSKIAPLMLGIALIALLMGFFIELARIEPGPGGLRPFAVHGVGFIVWLLVFGIYSALLKSLPCVECGQRVFPKNPPEGPVLCPLCQKHGVALGDGGGQTSASTSVGRNLVFVLFSFLGLFVGLPLLLILALSWDVETWKAAVVAGIVAWVLIPAAWFLWFMGLYLVSCSEKRVFPRARRCAKEEGETLHVGPDLVWFTGQADPSAMIAEQKELVRSRVEALLGEPAQAEKPLRIVIFGRRKDFQTFLRPFLTHLRRSIGFTYRTGVLVLCTEAEPSQAGDVEATVRTLLCGPSMDRYGTPPSLLWLRAGIASFVDAPEHDEARRINRKMRASLSIGTAQGTELFTLAPARLMKISKKLYDFNSFRELSQASYQSASMFRFLIKEGEAADGLAALRGFLSDLKEGGEAASHFETRFGFNYDEFLRLWKLHVMREDPDQHTPAPEAFKRKLETTIAPLLRDPGRSLMDRIVAVRNLGTRGYIEGADTLIERLRNPDEDVPKAEIVWALEAISGRTLGTDPDAWTDWLEAQATLSPGAG